MWHVQVEEYLGEKKKGSKTKKALDKSMIPSNVLICAERTKRGEEKHRENLQRNAENSNLLKTELHI